MGCHIRCGPSVCVPEGVRAVQGGRGAGTCSISASSGLSRGKRRGREQRRGTSSISRVLLEGLFKLLNALFVTVANFMSCALAVVAFLLLSRRVSVRRCPLAFRKGSGLLGRPRGGVCSVGTRMLNSARLSN